MTGAPRWPGRFTAIAVFLLAAGVYANSLANGFVYDDLPQILANPWIGDVRNVPQILLSPAWGFLGHVDYYRPLIHLLYMLETRLFGFEPWGFHLVSLLLHATCTVLVLHVAGRLLRLTRRSDAGAALRGPELAAAGVSALIFAVHPIHVESVAWVSGCQDLAAGCLMLLSLALHLRGRTVLGASCWLLGALCKETALVLPALLALADVLLRRPLGTRGRLARGTPYLVAAGVYATLRLAALPGLARGSTHTELSAWDGWLNAVSLFARYLGKLVFPLSHNAAYVFHPVAGPADPRCLAGAAVALAFVAAFVACVRQRGGAVAALGLAWYGLTLLPALYLPALGEHPFAERYLYLPSIGGAFLLAAGLARVAALPAWSRTAARGALGAALAAALILGSARTLGRNRDWRDELSLWEDTVQKSPDGQIAHNNLGRAYAELGRTEEAIRQFEIALELRPTYAEAHTNLGLALERRGRVQEAVEHYRTALRIDPANADAHSNLGVVLFNAGRLEEARLEFEQALRSNPRHPEAHNNLGNLYSMSGRLPEAIEEYRATLALRPELLEVRFNLAVAYAQTGRKELAVEQLRHVLARHPEDRDASALLRELASSP